MYKQTTSMKPQHDVKFMKIFWKNYDK